MPELVYQTWERITGRPWSDAAAGGFTDGSYAANMQLRAMLLAGWNPYEPSTAPPVTGTSGAPSTPSTPSPSPADTAGGDTSLNIEPGMWLEIQEEILAMQKYIADLEAELSREAVTSQEELAAAQIEFQERMAREQLGVSSRATEAAFMQDPRDFVALEEFRRSMTREHPDVALQGTPHTDPELSAMIEGILGQGGAEAGAAGGGGQIGPTALYDPSIAGTGYAGAEIAGAGSYTRSQFQGLTQRQKDILASFLKAGVETETGAQIGIDPQEYFSDVARSFVPTIQVPTRTRYQY